MQDQSRVLAPPQVQPDAAALAGLRVVPTRHPGRWLATAVVAVLLAMVVSSLVTNDRWQWSVVAQYLTWPSVLTGLWGTLRLTFAAAVIGFGLGTVLALMRLSRSPLLRSVAWGYTWVFRSVPLILQLLLWYNLAYLYPEISFGIPFGPAFTEVDTLSIVGKFGAAVLGLGLSQAAYSAEIVRAGILGVDQGQHEAAAALGIPRSRQQLRIVLPQAMRTIVPTSINEIIGLVKGTSVVYVLAYGELFYTVGVIYGRNLKVVPLLMVAAIWYLIITTVLTVGQYYLERHYAKGALRTLPPTPVQRLRWTTHALVSRVTGRPLPASVPPTYAVRSTLGGSHLYRTGTPRSDVGSGL
ncbi:amino acid ABC transporter permease [Cellulomonas sp. P5_C5]